jgi:hypothetical protein
MSGLLLLKREPTPVFVTDLIEKLRETTNRMRVRCPSCAWTPESHARWMCVATGAPEFFSPGCGTAWNTFDTHGRCPGCAHQWQWTNCLVCHQWSPHDDWYEVDDDDRASD